MAGLDWLVMKLLQKGFLLIAFPILGQLFFVVFLISVNRTSEELAWRSTHFRTQTQELMNLSILMYKSIGKLSVYGIANQSQSLKAFDTEYQQLQRKVELVALLDQENPTELSKRAKKNLTRMMGDLYSARQMLETKGSMGEFLPDVVF